MHDKIFAVNTFNIKLTYNVNNHFKYRDNNIIIASKKIKYFVTNFSLTETLTEDNINGL